MKNINDFEKKKMLPLNCCDCFLEYESVKGNQ